MNEAKILFTGKTSKGLDVILRYPMRTDLNALWKFINTLSQERTFLLIQGVDITLEDEEKYLDDVLENVAQHKQVQVLVFAENHLIGNAEISLGSGVNAHVGGLGIAVAKPYRGKGVGELLMQVLLDEAAAQLPGIKMVTLSVFGNNETGRNLYRKMGFVEYGRLPGGTLHHNQYVDMVYMVKPINASGS